MDEEKEPKTTEQPDLQAQITALQNELSASKATAAEKEQAAQFWYSKANAKPEEKKEPATEEEEDILELIGKGGSKGLEGWLKKKGLVTKGEVETLVQKRASQLVKENQMVDRYPELKDKSSDFFKATSVEYIGLKKQGVSDELAMEMAAEKVELAQLRSGKRKVQTADEKEEERLERVRAQSGDRGRRAPTDRTKSDTVSKEEQVMMKRFGVSEEEYKKSKAAMVVAER